MFVMVALRWCDLKWLCSSLYLPLWSEIYNKEVHTFFSKEQSWGFCFICWHTGFWCGVSLAQWLCSVLQAATVTEQQWALQLAGLSPLTPQSWPCCDCHAQGGPVLQLSGEQRWSLLGTPGLHLNSQPAASQAFDVHFMIFWLGL
jgi:hypothetical protein